MASTMTLNYSQLLKKARETATGAGSALVALSIALHAILDLVGVICSKLF